VLKFTFAIIFALVLVAPCAGTTLPVGPITFSSNSQYDANFKEPIGFAGIFRNAPGSLELFGSPTGTAAFDTGATGGSSGFGGTGGPNVNNDLSNFTISADFASTNPNGIGGGFLLRMNNSEAGGYAASVHSISTSTVTFQLHESSGLFGAGPLIFSQNVSLANLTLVANTFYNFKVTATDGTFQFNFASGAATASFTDATVSATTGQVGIIMDTINVSAAQYLDNFAIVPEPASVLLMGSAIAAFLAISPGRPFSRRENKRFRRDV
jgi:hypothetical protein